MEKAERWPRYLKFNNGLILDNQYQNVIRQCLKKSLILTKTKTQIHFGRSLKEP